MYAKHNVKFSPVHNRLASGVWMLQEIIEIRFTHGSEIFVMYDIACTVFGHLQVMSVCLSVHDVKFVQHVRVYFQSLGRSDILDNVHLCLPTFHSYGHEVSCQVLSMPVIM